MTPWERYFLLGRRAGCPMDQMTAFAKANVVLQQRQLAASAAARLCDRLHGPTAIGYGGARGGGKSHWLLAQMGFGWEPVSSPQRKRERIRAT